MSRRSLRCYPTSDPDFIAAAADRLAELSEAADAEIEGELEDWLRPRYPKVLVRRMEVIAKERAPDEVWYVYRDGRLRASQIIEGTTRLEPAPSVADVKVHLDTEGIRQAEG